LNQSIKNLTIAVDRPPKPEFAPADMNDHFIKVPLIRRRRSFLPDGSGILCAKFSNPLPDRLIAHDDAARGKQILDITQAQGEPKKDQTA
jgi:hypothetical protein